MEHISHLLVQAIEEGENGERFIRWDTSNFSTNNILWSYSVYFFMKWW